jgi:hypothetical protein
LHHTLVGGDGRVLSVERRTANDSYNVFMLDPSKGPQVVVNGPAPGSSAASPAGWLAGSQTTWNIRGNNVAAYLDAKADNRPDRGGTAVTDGNFLTAVNLLEQPSTTGNRAVAVQNLFVLTNRAHDILWAFGFNEAAGNFQVDNFGRGGTGSDAVRAEAQDGSGTDNANFATPPDGQSPRMQMFLWNSALPDALVTVNTADYGLFSSAFGPKPTQAGITGPLALYNDGTGVASDACEASVGSLSGRVAVVDRGTCNFTVKVLNAQRAGALGVVIVNNSAAAAFSPGGTDRKIKIPSGMVSQADGATLRALAGASARLHLKPVAPLMIDGDLDADIVFHEYGHGLTWRMIGGMSGPLAGAIGEGASDTVAFTLNGDDIIGEYAFSNPNGIRRFRYEGYPLSYADVRGLEVHDDGEIYAGAMWRLRGLYLGAGLTAGDLMGDFVDGMNFTPSTPAFEHMRDGMLSSIAARLGAGGAARCALVWQAFAKSGIGVGAQGVANADGTVSITPSSVAGTDCSH